MESSRGKPNKAAIGADVQPGTRTGGRTEVAWGCREHGTPRGQACEYCDRQGELFPRAEVGRAVRVHRTGRRR